MAERFSRNSVIDILRVIGAFLVVTIHAYPFQDILPVVNFILTQSVARVAVPFFFVTSGYFLASTFAKGKFGGWMRKILWLYLIWMIIYAPMWMPKLFELRYPVLPALNIILIGYFHLWYLIALAMAAGVLFFLRNLPERTLAILLSAALALGLALQYISLYSHNDVLVERLDHSYLYRSFLTIALPYLGVGYLYARGSEFSEWLASNSLALLVAGLTLLSAETWLNWHFALSQSKCDNLFGVALIVPALFSIAKRQTFSVSGRLSYSLGPISLAIYLLHIGFFLILTRYSGLGPAATWLVTFAVSVVAGWILIHPRNPLRRWLI